MILERATEKGMILGLIVEQILVGAAGSMKIRNQIKKGFYNQLKLQAVVTKKYVESSVLSSHYTLTSSTFTSGMADKGSTRQTHNNHWIICSICE